MLTEREKKELLKTAAQIFVIWGALLTGAFAIYFLVEYFFKKWS